MKNKYEKPEMTITSYEACDITNGLTARSVGSLKNTTAYGNSVKWGSLK